MINHNELQIGDWIGVRDPERSEEPGYYQVFEILEDGIRVEDFTSVYEDEWLVPITIAHMEIKNNALIINGTITIPFNSDIMTFSYESFYECDYDYGRYYSDAIYRRDKYDLGGEWHFSNCFGDRLRGNNLSVHNLQHIINIIAPPRK